MSSAPSPRATPSTPSPRGSWTYPTPPGSGPPSGSSGGSLPRTPSTPSGSFPSPPSSSSGTVVPVVITLGGVALLVILPFVCYLWRERRRRDDGAAYDLPRQGPKAGGPSDRQHQKVSRPSDHVVTPLPPKPNSNLPSSSAPAPLVLGYSTRAFTYQELARATNGFSEPNFLGQGGFGPVHKGELHGRKVAVKQLKAGSSQGETEFKTEVDTISRVNHRHLISLVGYCIDGAKRLLVYEFVPNKNLDNHLHGKGYPTMEWSTRVKIALGSAKGLSYLHEDCNSRIIHRDIKAANILIDFNFEPKVGDFGLAKIASDTNTHVSTRVMGTPGYMAPEYASSGKLTEKSDVYSFGVVLLELITGRSPLHQNLVAWARPLLKGALEEGNFEVLPDTKLNNQYNQQEMARMVACAAACVRQSADLRPSMSQIVRVLEGNLSLSDLNKGIRPGQSNVYDREDMMKKYKLAFGTQENSASAENSNPTSDYKDCQTTPEMEMAKIKGNGPGFSGGPSI